MTSRWFALIFFFILAACQPEPVVLPTVADPAALQTEFAATTAALATPTNPPLPPTWTPLPIPTEQPTFTPISAAVEQTAIGRLYYIYNNDSIARINEDGTEPALVLASGNPRGLTLSPNGKSLAYVADAGNAREIYICQLSEPDCTQTQPITRLGFAQITSPAWSPDGSQIAFLAAQIPSAPPGVYLMRADGAGQRIIVQTNTPTASELRWNSSGTKLFYTAEIIYGVNISENRIYTLTTTLGFGPDFGLAPSPLREELFYFKTRVNPQTGQEGGVIYSINTTTLTDLPSETADAPVYANRLRWSHDGLVLLISANGILTVRDDQFGTSIQIFSSGTGDPQPVFSPDDRFIAFVNPGLNSPVQQIFKIDRLGGTPVQLTTHQEGSVSDLVWAPG